MWRGEKMLLSNLYNMLKSWRVLFADGDLATLHQALAKLQHIATTSPSAWPKPGVLTHVDFAGGGYVKFGSIAWESAFYKCSADGY